MDFPQPLHRNLTLLVYFFCWLPLLLTAQPSADRDTQYVDSLTVALQNATSDEERYDCLFRLSSPSQYDSPGQAIPFAKRLVKVGLRLGDLFHVCESNLRLSYVSLTVGNTEEQEKAFLAAQTACDQCQEPKCSFAQYSYYRRVAKFHENAGSISVALQEFQKIEALDTIKPWHLMKYYNLRGTFHYELAEYDQAIDYLNRGLQVQLPEPDLDLETAVLFNLVNVFRATGDMQRAIEVSYDIIRIARQSDDLYVQIAADEQASLVHEWQEQFDSAFYYAQLMLEGGRKVNGWYYIPNALSQLIRLAIKLDRPEIEDYIIEANALLKDPIPEMRIYEKTSLLISLITYAESKGNFQRANTLAQKLVDDTSLTLGDTSNYSTSSREILTRTQAGLGNYKAAWETYNELYTLRVAQLARNQEQALARTAVEMDLAKQESARLQAEETVRLERLATATRTRYFLFSLALVGIILVLVIWALARTRNDRALIAEKNALISEALAEKDVLLKEIHHRVKNNLQIISSLLDKQARQSSDAAVRRLVREGQERIHSMALVHQNLYQSDHVQGIDMRSYLAELTSNIQQGYAKPEAEIQLDLEVADEKLDIDRAIPVGLILNELITNSYKYAFKNQEKGQIHVAFSRSEGGFQLSVADNGVGFPEDFGGRRKGGLGFNLVRGLVRQLSGQLNWDNQHPGAVVQIQFA